MTAEPCDWCDGDGRMYHEGTPWPILRALGIAKPDGEWHECERCHGSGLEPVLASEDTR